jgi:membrane-bound lytic murein transglycosylase B
MKHLWALVSTLLLTLALVVTGVAAWAGTTESGPDTSPENGTASADALAAASVVPTDAANGFYWQLLAPQAVLPTSFLLARGEAHKGARGTRSDKQFFEISSTGSNDVPAAALAAYQRADLTMAEADPSCHISWTLLAAIGRVESNHGRFGGAQLGADGVSRPEIRGPELNGAGAFAAIKDTDRGVLDHDTVWDRAVGQMQFLPETWNAVARDGDGDGRKNPDDIDDSALGAAVYLCGAGGRLDDPAGAARAAFRYNHSDYYVQLVLSFQAGYQTGVFALPSPPPPADATQAPKVARPKHVTKPRTTQAPAAQPKPTASKPAAPKPSATPKPAPAKATPTPSGPRIVPVDGTWNACGLGFCLGTTGLDLGTAEQQGSRANADFDGDGTVETNTEEFTGLVGKHVTLQAERTMLGYVVYVIDGEGLRNADGSFAHSAPAIASASATP